MLWIAPVRLHLHAAPGCQLLPCLCYPGPLLPEPQWKVPKPGVARTRLLMLTALLAAVSVAAPVTKHFRNHPLSRSQSTHPYLQRCRLHLTFAPLQHHCICLTAVPTQTTVAPERSCSMQRNCCDKQTPLTTEHIARRVQWLAEFANHNRAWCTAPTACIIRSQRNTKESTDSSSFVHVGRLRTLSIACHHPFQLQPHGGQL